MPYKRIKRWNITWIVRRSLMKSKGSKKAGFKGSRFLDEFIWLVCKDKVIQNW